MKFYVLDTSVAIAWYLPESFSPKAKRWQERMLDGSVIFVTPTLHYWEVANVLRTYVMRRELDPKLAEEIYALHLEAPIEVTEPDKTAVLSTSLRYQATAYDSVCIALCLSRQIPLLTAEKTTNSWVVKLGKLAQPLV
jgi:predicted nucleic acid-binding protein